MKQLKSRTGRVIIVGTGGNRQNYREFEKLFHNPGFNYIKLPEEDNGTIDRITANGIALLKERTTTNPIVLLKHKDAPEKARGKRPPNKLNLIK